jgi:DNA-directed RNA polymerase specialized sigma24 family protein
MPSANAKNNYVPTDYADFYLYYIQGSGHGNSLCHQIIRSMMPYADQQEREDLAHNVFLRAYEKKILDVFDPTKSNFGGVIFFLTRTVVVNHLGRKSRNPITGLKAGTLVDGDAESETFEPGVYHLDRLFLSESPDPGDRMDLQSLFNHLVDRCKQLQEQAHPTAYRDTRKRSLLPLLELLIRECEPDECGAQLGVTASTIANWLVVLQEMVEEIKATVLAPPASTEPPPPMLPIED